MKEYEGGKKRIQCICAVIALLCGLLSQSGCASHERPQNLQLLEENPLIYAENPSEENMADVLQRAAAGVMVQITVGQSIGSGVLWKMTEEELIIASAGHVFTQTDGEIAVIFADGWMVPVKDYTISSETDLAFLFIKRQEIPEEHLEKYYLANANEESFTLLQSGDSVILMASATGVAADAYEGVLIDSWVYVEDFGQYMMLARVEAVPGMSGGGLFDIQGHFLGILCGSDEDGEAAIVPLTVISTFYENISDD